MLIFGVSIVRGTPAADEQSSGERLQIMLNGIGRLSF
jgi:hypothetical protein